MFWLRLPCISFKEKSFLIKFNPAVKQVVTNVGFNISFNNFHILPKKE